MNRVFKGANGRRTGVTVAVSRDEFFERFGIKVCICREILFCQKFRRGANEMNREMPVKC